MLPSEADRSKNHLSGRWSQEIPGGAWGSKTEYARKLISWTPWWANGIHPAGNSGGQCRGSNSRVRKLEYSSPDSPSVLGGGMLPGASALHCSSCPVCTASVSYCPLSESQMLQSQACGGEGWGLRGGRWELHLLQPVIHEKPLLQLHKWHHPRAQPSSNNY